MGLTALPLIFRTEYDQLSSRANVSSLPTNAPALPLASIISLAAQKRTHGTIQYVIKDPNQPCCYTIVFGNARTTPSSRSDTVLMEAASGRVLSESAETEQEGGLMHVALTLHTDLYAGRFGKLLLAAMAVLFSVSLISGVIIYGPFTRTTRFGTVRTNMPLRTRVSDLHKLFGVTVFVWMLLIGVTGFVNSAGAYAMDQWSQYNLHQLNNPLSEVPGHHPIQSVPIALAQACAMDKSKSFAFLAMPGNRLTSDRHYCVFLRGVTRVGTPLLTPVFIDAATGRVSRLIEVPFYIRALLLSRFLHPGHFGGLITEVIWLLMTFALIGSLVSGLAVAFTQHRKLVLIPVERRAC